MKRIATLCGLFVAGALVFSSCNDKEDNENNDFQSEQVQTYYLYDMFEDLQCESLKYGHDIANNTCFTINSKEEFLELCSDEETADRLDFPTVSILAVKTTVPKGVDKEHNHSHACLQKVGTKKYILEIHFHPDGSTQSQSVYRCYLCPFIDTNAQIEVKSIIHAF
ncbi:MAG: hypothetical protein ACI3Z9_00355 [Candidatus Onthomorpha sp.]